MARLKGDPPPFVGNGILVPQKVFFMIFYCLGGIFNSIETVGIKNLLYSPLIFFHIGQIRDKPSY